YAAILADRLEPVGQRTERAQALRNEGRRHTGFMDRQGAREGVCDVVIAEQLELVAFEQRLSPEPQRATRLVVRGVRGFRERKQRAPPRHAVRQLEHQWVV